MRILLALALPLFLAAAALAAPPDPVTIDLPGKPFGITASHDGNWIFVAITVPSSGVAVLQHEGGQYKLARVVPLDGRATGVVLTHDGKSLIVATGPSVSVLDTAKMISGAANPVLGTFTGAGSIYVNVSADDKFLFISEERGGVITVIDLDRARSGGFGDRAVVGDIPVGEAPIALTFSPDGRWLYTTSEGAFPDWNWPSTEKPEDAGPADNEEKVPPGAVLVIDVAKARTDPAHSVVARVPAGSSPVRMTISPDGRFIFVTARGSDAVLEFDTAKLISDPEHSRLATVTVGSAPVPVALIRDGNMLVVGNSNRFGAAAGKPEMLSVVDVSKMTIIGTIRAGVFPREMCRSADGKTLFVSNFGSSTLEIIDAQNPPIDSN